MHSLKEIRDYQDSEFVRIKDLGVKIHPKLLSRINFDNLMDDNFKAEEYEKKYHETIRPLIIAYKKKLKDMLNSHLVDFIEGWTLVHPEGRWAMKKSDGVICSAPDYYIIDSFDEYIFDTEIEDYCQLVYEMLDDYQILPFWERSVTLCGDGYNKHISSTYSASKYIQGARNQFSGHKTNYEVLEKLALDSNSLPYKMLLPTMSRELSSIVRSSTIQSCVKHHKVLHAFFEQFGKDASNGAYYSSEMENGEIKFCRRGI